MRRLNVVIDNTLDNSVEDLKELLESKELIIKTLHIKLDELKKENELLLKYRGNPNEAQKFIRTFRSMELKIKENENILQWHINNEDELYRKLEDLENRNKQLLQTINAMSKQSLYEHQLHEQLQQAQEKIRILEQKQVYPPATKKDANGEPISDNTIVQMFNGGMNPNQISEQIGLTHQAIRARLKKLGLYKTK
jgi:chromosome segregation ATPase